MSLRGTDTRFVRDYGQYCPIARGAEVFAERWTPIILLGCRTFNEIAAGAPRRSRALQRADILEILPKPDGHGSVYAPTPAGAQLQRYTSWLLIEQGDAEVCAFDPGYGDDLVVTISDPVVFARWHLGLVEWGAALRSGGLGITGPAELRRALPTWNGAPAVFARRRAGTPLVVGAEPAQMDVPSL